MNYINIIIHIIQNPIFSTHEIITNDVMSSICGWSKRKHTLWILYYEWCCRSLFKIYVGIATNSPWAHIATHYWGSTMTPSESNPVDTCWYLLLKKVLLLAASKYIAFIIIIYIYCCIVALYIEATIVITVRNDNFCK